MFIYVASALTPSEFYGLVSNDDSFRTIADDIRDSCNELWSSAGPGRVDFSQPQLPRDLMVRVAPNLWARCCKPVVKNGAVSVELVDAGNRRLSVPANVRAVRMTKSLKQFKSFPFCLAGVEPIIGNTWTKNGRDAFVNLVQGKVFETPNYNSRNITLIDINSKQSVAAMLVQLGFAKESIDSDSACGTIDAPNIANLPVEAQVFLERSGGLDFGQETPVETDISAIMKAVREFEHSKTAKRVQMN